MAKSTNLFVPGLLLGLLFGGWLGMWWVWSNSITVRDEIIADNYSKLMKQARTIDSLNSEIANEKKQRRVGIWPT